MDKSHRKEMIYLMTRKKYFSANHIYIGENLEVMNQNVIPEKSIDTIYIDPPYNTKRNFSYEDSRTRQNWLDFLNLRLLKAKSLLKDTGIIFISIDDNEYAYLKVLCDEIFDSSNFIGTFITHQAQRSNAKFINTTHEYVICYAKNKEKAKEFKIKRINIPEEQQMIISISKEIKKAYFSEGKEVANEVLKKLINQYCTEKNITWLKNYSCIDENGDVYFGKDLSTPGVPRTVNIPEINLHLEALPTRGWSSDKKFKELYQQNKLVFKDNRPYEKHLLVDSEEHASSILNYYSRQGSNDLNKLGLRDIFDTPKPVELIKYLIRISTPINGIVLDFFAGSGTTAQAVYELNQEETSNRKYILIQQEEAIAPQTTAFQKCKEFSLKPVISEVLLYRIKKFLEQKNITDDELIIERSIG